MTRRTRVFVIASLVVLCAGVGTGLVAYFGFSTSAFTAAAGPDELRFLPSNATLVAFADVHEVMTSELRQKLRSAMPFTGDGQRSFQEETGINIETDLDRVVFGLTPPVDAGDGNGASGLVLARGRFDAVRIDAFLREKGASTEQYKGRTIFTRPVRSTSTPGPDSTLPGPRSSGSTPSALVFIEPGLVGVGSPALVRRAIDLKDGGDNVLASEPIMSRVRELESGNVWAVGRFDALTSSASLAPGMASQLPAITWFSASGQVDSGIRAALKAQTRDEESANGLRDLVRGFIALAKMQAGSRPEFQSLVQSLQLGGTGQTVTLSIDLTPQMLELLTNAMGQLPRPSR